MTLPAHPNTISLSAIQGEFTGSNPISLREYYAGAANGYVRSGTIGYPGGVATAIPSSGAIKLGNFHGATRITYYMEKIIKSTWWTVPSGVTSVTIVAVAGGGGGGSSSIGGLWDGGGGGGAGGVIVGSPAVTPGTSYYITIGAGGAGSTKANVVTPTKGLSTWVGTTEVIGGGNGSAGGSAWEQVGIDPKTGSSQYDTVYHYTYAGNGGSGGGGFGAWGGAVYGGLGGSGTPGMGNRGGNAGFETNGSGGGAGAAATNAPGSVAGNGIQHTWNGLKTDPVGGGGGHGGSFDSKDNTALNGGWGGGGYGGLGQNYAYNAGRAGYDNTGGGGGGGGGAYPNGGGDGGNGGSGVVFIFYAK